MIKLLSKQQSTAVDNGWEAILNDFSPIKNAIAPSIIKEELDYITLGKNFARTLVIKDFPSNVKGNWLTDLYRFKGNLSISTHIVPTTANNVIQYYGKSIDQYEALLLTNLNAQRRQDIIFKKESSELMLKKLMQGNNNIIFNVHMYLHIQAEKLDELNRLTTDLETEINKTGMTGMIPSTNMLKAFKACLPTVENTLPEYTFRNMDAEALSSLFPFDESELFHETGIYKGVNLSAGGSPVIVDQYKLNNHNEFVIGKSGAGKSFYLSIDMLRHIKDDIRVFAIDPLRDFKNLVEKVGGQHIVISSMSAKRINPLEIIYTKNVEEENNNVKISLLHQKINRLKIWFKLIKKDLKPIESALIEDILIETYAGKNIDWDTDFSTLKPEQYPILGDFYELMKGKNEYRLRDFMAILKTFVEGSNSLMFNGTTNVKLDNDKIICFDLKDLEKESDVQPAAMYNILTYIWDEISKSDKKRQRLYVDECHVLADPDNPKAMKFLFDIYKTDRHFKCGTTAATQQISDFLTAIEGHKNYGKAIIGNSVSKTFLTLESTDIQDLKEYNVIKLSEEEERILSGENRGEGIFIAGKKRVHIQIEATPEELKFIDPEQYREKYGVR